MEQEKLQLKDGAMWLASDLKNVLQEVYDHYRSVVQRNEWLEKENERIKSERYKDEELTAMSKSYDKMKDDYFRGFPISETEKRKIDDFEERMIKEHPFDTGCIGGRFVYEFLPTSIGVIGTVKDTASGEKLEFREIF